MQVSSRPCPHSQEQIRRRLLLCAHTRGGVYLQSNSADLENQSPDLALSRANHVLVDNRLECPVHSIVLTQKASSSGIKQCAGLSSLKAPLACGPQMQEPVDRYPAEYDQEPGPCR